MLLRCLSSARRYRPLRCAGWLTVLIGVLFALAAHAVESDPLPQPKGDVREHAVDAYNSGVKLMLERRFAEAQAKFEEALAGFEAFPEAHNNLGFSLRMQGGHNFERARKHYDRALELEPRLARAYMYRGVLHTQMGDLPRARADHARLLELDRELADKLLRAIESSSQRDAYEGLAPQVE